MYMEDPLRKKIEREHAFLSSLAKDTVVASSRYISRT